MARKSNCYFMLCYSMLLLAIVINLSSIKNFNGESKINELILTLLHQILGLNLSNNTVFGTRQPVREFTTSTCCTLTYNKIIKTVLQVPYLSGSSPPASRLSFKPSPTTAISLPVGCFTMWGTLPHLGWNSRERGRKFN